MSNIVEKIAERYADEIAGLPSLGTLTVFLLTATSAYMIEAQSLHWIPPVSDVFSNSLAKLFDTKDGLISGTSLGGLLIAAGATFLLKYFYTTGLRRGFSLLAKTSVVEKFITTANGAARSAGLNDAALDNCTTTFLSDELSVQRRIFQRIHGAAFVVFAVAVLSLGTLLNVQSAALLALCCAGLLWLEYLALRHYLTRLFPALCVVWSAKGKPAVFGEE